jgi:hypothetical protein
VVGRAILVVFGLALAFLLGIAFARTLDERPKSSGPETIVRTLTPLPQDAPIRTVTVTVTGP